MNTKLDFQNSQLLISINFMGLGNYALWKLNRKYFLVIELILNI